MRVIKFRLWDTKHESFVNEPYHAISLLGSIQIEGHTSVEQKRYILQQFTGLLDKAGKEIYEGDILKVDWKDSRYPIHIIGPVAWDTEEACWNLGEGASAKLDAAYYMQVIGNIYENPELIV